jgi:hypothetical protein
MSEITNDLFISFNWSLNTQIKTLEHNLLQKGLKIFREQKEENIDNPLTSQLASAIQKSKFFLCCINTAYCKSHNCNLQIEYANSLAKPIFTLLIDDLNLEDMSFLVTGRKNTKTRIGSILTNCYIIKCFNDTDNWFNDTSKLNDIKRHIAGDPIVFIYIYIYIIIK